jgi:hypothetical protein
LKRASKAGSLVLISSCHTDLKTVLLDNSVEFLQIGTDIENDEIYDGCLDEVISERVRQIKLMCKDGVKIRPLHLL